MTTTDADPLALGRRTRTVTALVTAALLLAGCGATTPKVTHPPAPRSSATMPVGTSTSTPTKVLVVIEENHSYAQMRSGMPFLARLSNTYGYATHWTALAHPSLPNYLGIAGGTTFGIRDDKPPAAHKSDIGSARSVFDQALAAGKTAATYAESMPQNCYVDDYPDPANGTSRYAVRHNPWVYFSVGRSNCLAHDVALTSFAKDASRNALPNVGFLIPDLDNDAHDGSLSTADAWLQEQLTPVLASTDFKSGKLVVVVTADEDDKKSGNEVLTSVITPAISHKVVHTPLTHYSLTRYIAQLLHAVALGNGANAPDMKAAFGL